MRKMLDAQKLANMLLESKIVTVFTGAGMSTESGLPDFRSADGLWQDKDSYALATTDAMNNNFKEFIDFYQERIFITKELKPNIGHQILANWQKHGIVTTIVTQNVDSFHQLAGAKDVIELHGNLAKMSCLGCRKQYDSDCITKVEKEKCCDNCQSNLRPCVVLFGESLPRNELDRASNAASRSNLFVVLGSSLEVAPANMLPLQAKYAGAKLCIINKGKTRLDDDADLLINDSIGNVLTTVNKLLAQKYDFLK